MSLLIQTICLIDTFVVSYINQSEYPGTMNRDKRFVVELQEDVASGELLLPIPERILSDMGWYEGTVLEIDVEGDELIIREADQ